MIRTCATVYARRGWRTGHALTAALFELCGSFQSLDTRAFSAAASANQRAGRDLGIITPEMLIAIWHKEEGSCPICYGDLITLDWRHVHVDHIVPVSKGGNNAVENLQFVCAACNIEKSDTWPRPETMFR